jgi:hypothetical protein
MSRRVRAAYDSLDVRDRFRLPWTASGPIDPPSGPLGGPIDHAEKANDFNAGPNGPLGPIGLTGHGGKSETFGSPSPREGGSRKTGPPSRSSRTDYNFRLDRLDRLDQPSSGAGLPPPRAGDHAGPIGPEPPPWPDVDALRRAYGEARGVEAKRAMVAEWAAAAGGRVENGALLLPADVPNSLALATLKTYARCVGLRVEAIERHCSRCPNPPLPGDSLCDACRWLVGPRP